MSDVRTEAERREERAAAREERKEERAAARSAHIASQFWT
jgi:hypothetical protein